MISKVKEDASVIKQTIKVNFVFCSQVREHMYNLNRKQKNKQPFSKMKRLSKMLK